MVDFHTHILPGADHGSHSIDISLRQLALAKKHGVDKIIATSHFYPHVHSVDEFISLRNTSYNNLKKKADADSPQIKLGAEVLLCDGMEKLSGLELLCISGTNILLLELPFDGFEESYVSTVKKIINKGIRVILAHADRYDADSIERLVDVGAKIQLNASAFSCIFPKKHLTYWLKRGLVVALGSDIHGADSHAYIRFNRAIKRLGAYASYVSEQSNKIWDMATEYSTLG